MGRNPDLVNSDTLKDPNNLSSNSAFSHEYFARMRIASTFVRTGQLAETGTPGEMLAWLDRVKLSVPPDLLAAVEAMDHRIADWYSECQRLNEQLTQMQKHARHQEYVSATWERRCVEMMATYEKEQSETIEALRLITVERNELSEQVASQGKSSVYSEPSTRGIDPRRYRSALVIIHGVAVGKFKFGEDSMAGRSAVKNMTSSIELAGHSITTKTVGSVLKEAAEALGKSRK